jgi:sigma-B regulation protein RsbQ
VKGAATISHPGHRRVARRVTCPIVARPEQHSVRVLGPVGAQPMLLAHGYGCDQNMWRSIVPRLAERHRVVLFDHIGAGGSDVSAYDPARYGSLEGYATDVIGLCDALKLRDVIFVGHSVSGMVGVLAAAAAPHLFSSLVLVAPSPRYVDDDGYVGGFSRRDIDEMLASLDSDYLGWSSAVAPVIMGRPDRPDLSQEFEDSFCRTDPEIAAVRARHVPVRQPGGSRFGADADAGAAVHRRRHRTGRGRRVRPRPDAERDDGPAERNRSLPAPVGAGRDRGRDRTVLGLRYIRRAMTAGDGDVVDGFIEALLDDDAQTLYERAPCGYLSTTPDGTIIKANATFLTHSGYTRDDLVGRKRFVDLLTGGGRVYQRPTTRPCCACMGSPARSPST